jgi:CRISPR-associated endonuclease/helicase Cas3
VGELLAKSERLPASHSAYLIARERSKYPRGGRHEPLSLRLVENTQLGEVSDRDLFVHLIASHYGYCRPFAPVIEDLQPLTVSIAWNGARLTAVC